ncbi:leucyl aminopeptidase [Roseivivax lentus]|uniref:Leucyl aminopeptidase n=1 Tax=Roseivivax lentus TaxID=633194 RepID=A0A1N7MGT0_9RHOB|nr:leucyl aminopeptidase family protein [Roseivivax lentus]SIS85262.1 leucyl aminopeptidase [Roseivivax lentus]
MTLRFATAAEGALDLHVLEQGAVDAWLSDQPDHVAAWVRASGFEGGIGDTLVIPGPDGGPTAGLAGYGNAAARARVRFTLAAAAPRLQDQTWRIASGLPGQDAEREALGWLLTGYGFSRYRDQTAKTGALVAPEGIDADRVEILAAAEVLTRDLINTPAADMGPEALEEAVWDLARDHDAHVEVIAGQGLLDHNLPMIHAVGRAAKDDPRLIDMTWGDTGPHLVLVGKGVCFDTGGLNLKPGASMGLMKKDMGGAAAVLGLAKAIMALELKLRLRVLIPAVENSVAGNSFRPQDILHSRKGLTVEINNTDAEGRLVLADALALADETAPDLILSMATLTGAARVAVGPDIAPFFATDDALARAFEAAAPGAADPVWRLPFHDPYEPLIEPGIADLDNAPKGGFAGAITAALFLRRFVTETPRYAHFDIYGWQPQAAPGRTKGGIGQGARSILAALPEILDL